MNEIAPKRIREAYRTLLNYSKSSLASFVTSISLCLGMQAMFLSFNGRVDEAVVFICIAALMDGIDGRVARYLNSASEFGKTLDSLADFLSFSISPVMIIYFYKLHHWSNIGKSFCIFFVLCMAFRLARFSSNFDSDAFMGVPAPIAGLLSFMPIVVERVFKVSIPASIFAYNLIFIAIAMISKTRTLSLKKVNIKGINHIYFAIFSCFIVTTISYPWVSAFILSSIYLAYFLYSFLKR